MKSEWGQSRTPALVNKERPVGKRPEKLKGGKGRAREGTTGKELDQEGNTTEEGRPGKKRRVEEGNEEDPVRKEEMEPKEGGGDEDIKAGCLASLANTPVQVKVARFQRRIQAEKEEKVSRKVANKEGRKEGPTGKREMK